LVQDVPYIITDEERAAASKLTTDQQRDNFILAFWERRNPNPGSLENAFEKEHYRRKAYANEHFPANVEGWKTDRGRIYIIYGPPNSVESSDRLSVPTEIWPYASVQGLGQKVVLTFIDRDKDGSYPLSEEDVDSLPRIRDGHRVY
jgi:GWxTD domain-containing protein